MKTFGVALAAGAAALAGQQALAQTVIYNMPPAPTGNGFTQQTGNSAYAYGDDVHGIVPPGCVNPQLYIDFGFFTYDAATYTPTIEVDLYVADPSGQPHGLPFATAVNGSVTFTGSNYNAGGKTRSTEQSMCFDFTSVTLPQDFVFAYRDINPAGTLNPNYGFSVFIIPAPSDPTKPLQTNLPPEFYQLNGPDADAAPASSFGPYNIQASISCVPEPTSAGLLAIGGSLMALRRRKASLQLRKLPLLEKSRAMFASPGSFFQLDWRRRLTRPRM